MIVRLELNLDDHDMLARRSCIVYAILFLRWPLGGGGGLCCAVVRGYTFFVTAIAGPYRYDINRFCEDDETL